MIIQLCVLILVYFPNIKGGTSMPPVLAPTRNTMPIPKPEIKPPYKDARIGSTPSGTAKLDIIFKNTGYKILLAIVFNAKSFPKKNEPKTKQITIMDVIIVSTEIFKRGDSAIATPATPPVRISLGMIKNATAKANNKFPIIIEMDSTNKLLMFIRFPHNHF